MQRLFMLMSFAALLALVGSGSAGPTTPFSVQTIDIPALGGKVFSLEWEGNQRASALALGNGNTYLGLYVYDRHGNCVAWDDEGMPQTCDDLAVQWHPREKSAFMIEVHNCGLVVNNCKVVLR
jgi:hypothetical protein